MIPSELHNKRKKFICIDTETTGEIPQQIAYDVGFVVTDRYGTVYEKRSFVVKEVFADLTKMCSAYYSSKYGIYIDNIYRQHTVPTPFLTVLKEFAEMCHKWNVKTIASYNLSFDLRSMRNTVYYLTGIYDWLPYEMEEFCILNAACTALYGKDYCRTAIKNGWLTAKGNVKTSAECGYRYIKKEHDFEERHMGLDDCLIEIEIMREIFKKRKKFDHSVKGFPMNGVLKMGRELKKEMGIE